MTTPEGTGLSGMKQIASYVRRSEATTLKMIQLEGLPARKILGTWESDKTLIDEWRKRMVLAREDTRWPASDEDVAKPSAREKKKTSSPKRESRW